MQLARLARDQSRVSLKLLNLEMWTQKSRIVPKSDVRLLKLKGMESSVSNFSGNDNFAVLGAEAGCENFVTCCKLSSTEIFAI